METGQDILVVAEHDQIGELLVEFCAAAGHHAVQSRFRETPQAAYRRTEPRLMILDYQVAARTSFPWQGCLDERGTRVLLFSAGFHDPELRAFSGERGLPYFTLPIAWRDFVPLVNAALEG